MELTKTKEYLKMAEEDIRRLEDENAVSSVGFGNDDDSKHLLLSCQLIVLCIVHSAVCTFML